MINWRNKVTPGPRGDLPNTDWIDAIYFALYTNSAFLKLMNTDHPDSRRTASEINAQQQQRVIAGAYQHADKKEPARLPAAWLHVEAANNGWSIFVKARPGFGNVCVTQPDFVFNNVFDCARKVADLLQPTGSESRTESDLIAQLAQQGLVDGGTISGLREDLIKVQAALELMTAGRDQDRTEYQEVITRYQGRLETQEQTIKGYQAETDRLKQQRNEARAQVHEIQSQIAQLRQETFPQSLDVVRLTRELECACKQRDEMREHADRNRAGRVRAENELRQLKIDGMGYTRRLEAEIW